MTRWLIVALVMTLALPAAFAGTTERHDVLARMETSSVPRPHHHDTLKPEPLPASLRREMRADAVCVDDGTSGNRYQVWLVRSGRASRKNLVKQVREFAAGAQLAILVSSQKTGGNKTIQYVTDRCVIDVKKLALPKGAKNFGAIWDALKQQGAFTADRNHLVFQDTKNSGVCGVASWIPDDRPGPENRNNNGGGVAIVGRICWGYNVAMHEIGHTLGAVQPTSPHSTGAHCIDEYDVMCYDDDGDGPVKMELICANKDRDNGLYDCNDDDYWHAHPPAGSYLDTHWNSYNNVFLWEIP